eukprot:121335-Pelagomonas_calceolata.AAC.7
MFGPLHFLYADTMFALGNILLKQADLAKHSEVSKPGCAFQWCRTKNMMFQEALHKQADLAKHSEVSKPGCAFQWCRTKK